MYTYYFEVNSTIIIFNTYCLLARRARQTLVKMKPLKRLYQAMFSSKNFQDFPSYQIFGHLHGVLNVVKKIINCIV